MLFRSAKIEPAIQTQETPASDQGRREFIIWLYVLGFLAAILFLGFWISIPVFITLFLQREAGYSWRKAIVYGVVGGAVLYAIFAHGLKLELHKGFIVEAIGDLRG